MPKLTANDARELAELFMNASHELGTYRFENWGSLKKGERQILEDAAWDLLNYSTSFTTTAVGLALDDLDEDLKAIKKATSDATKAVAKIETVKKVLRIATALVVLGGAIASKDPGAILKGVKGVIEASKDDDKKDGDKKDGDKKDGDK